jgi:23S rRNA (guanine2445-N2)-methyltransferase / 23S rRNA (guanine2069-N7)-methyltransferase
MLSSWFVSCTKGLQGILLEELKSMGVKNTKETVAGVEFRDELAAAYKVCLWSRLANRVFLPLSTFPVEDADDLYQGAHDIPWDQHFDVNATIAVDFVGTGPGIDNTQFGAQRVKDGVVDYFRECCGQRPNVQPRGPDIRINARFARGKVVLSLDFSGESLHRRGYRTVNTRAPLKENLAAALLVRAGWSDQQYMTLIDPMCGSGTLLIEAAMMAADISPGLARSHYGFSHWLGHRPELWDELLGQAKQRREQGLAKNLPAIVGYDRDEQAVNAAKVNIGTAGLSHCISVSKQPLAELGQSFSSQDKSRGLVITNPPYGARMGEQEQLRPLYASLGSLLKQHFGGWRAGVFSANETLCFELGLRANKQYKLFNGALPAKLLLFDVFADEGGTSSARNPWLKQKSKDKAIHKQALSDGATMLANRLRKNQRKLRAWLRSEQIECYRLYDADLPEYAVAIDCYGDAIYVQEYAPPASVDSASAARHIEEVRQAVIEVMQPMPGRLFFKQRQRQRGDQQYERSSEGDGTGVFTVRESVTESGAKFEVDLAKYLDTGLFLDHRPIRQLLAKACAGKSFLNLFCYTASATVCAAIGGATQSLSIDMSNTYLDWAKRNFRLNNIDLNQHQLLRADCLAWLERGGDGNRYEVIFLDPPTFSNSKKMDNVLDIQRDHEILIRQAMNLLAEGGLLIFSSNLRRFKMAGGIVADFSAENITGQSIDKDFERRANIHHCWAIQSSSQATKSSSQPIQPSLQPTGKPDGK